MAYLFSGSEVVGNLGLPVNRRMIVVEKLAEQFAEEGYAIWERAFEPEEAERMRAEADSILELIINSTIAHGRKSGRLDILETEAGQLVRKIQPINDLSLYLARVSEDARLLDPLRTIMGDEPVLMEEKLNYKEPLPEKVPGIDCGGRVDDRFPIHSDWAYYKAQDYPQTIVSSAIAFDDCSPDTGPLHIWPGSHREDLPHERNHLGLEVIPGHIDPEGGIDVLAPAGSVMFFHSLLVHNSRPNVSGRPRRLMIYSHYPEAADMGHDVRNGPRRLEESPFEWEYQRMRQSGIFEDVFSAPVFEQSAA